MSSDVSETSLDDDLETCYQDFDDDATSGFNLFALFVLDASIPSTTINKIFKDAFDQSRYDYLWLASDYNSIDVECGDYPGHLDRNYHCTAVDEDWQSPWAGKDLQDVVEFVRNTPKPPKALNKVYFVILDKEQYDAHEWLMVYKIVEGEVQSLACTASMTSIFLEVHHRDTWADTLEDWQETGRPALL